MMAEHLAFGLDFDRDHTADLLRMTRQIYWPLVCFFFHPLVIFVVVKKSSMTFDCKFGYICHTIFMFGFDIYNGLLYQPYTLAPFPVFLCTGLLCAGAMKSADLMVVVSFFTVGVVIPYLFLMMRIHQRMLMPDSPLKVSIVSVTQILIMLALMALLFSKLLGFHQWTIDILNKDDILDTKDLVWAQNFTSNFLVLGVKVGDIGLFRYELILLVFSIVVVYTFYISITYHAIYKIGRQLSVRNSKTHQALLRVAYSLAIQSTGSGILFVSPMVILFVGLFVYQESWTWPWYVGSFLRPTFLLFYSHSSVSYWLVFIIRDPWCRQVMRRTIQGATVAPTSTSKKEQNA